jgi:ComEC/Rec2-related protein
MVISNAKLTVLAAVLAAVGAILNSANAHPIVAILFSVACFASLFHLSNASNRQRQNLRGLLLIFVLSSFPLAYFEYAQLRQNKPAPNDLLNFAGREVIFTCTANLQEAVGARELTLNADELEFPKKQTLSGKTQLTLRRPQDAVDLSHLPPKLATSVKLRVRGYIAAPRTNMQPWEYDKRKRLASAGIYSICYLGRRDAKSPAIEEIADHLQTPAGSDSDSRTLTGRFTSLANNYDLLMTNARSLIVETHRKYLPPKLADLLSSMVLGNRAVALKEEMTYKFRDVGLSHILAASGFNLTIVTAMSFAICRLLTPSVVLANLICFLSMLGFVSLAGPSPSVLRAALMCTIMLLAKSTQRRMLVSSALAAAFLITVTADPLCTNDLGLQLSYAATVGIVIGTRALSNQFYPGLCKWRRASAEAVSVVVVAQFSVMPIQIFFFWKAGTLFIPANLLVTPLVTPMTMIGFASSTVALLNAIPSPFQGLVGILIAFSDAIAFVPLTIMLLLVNAFSSCEAAKFSLGPPTVFSFIFYYIALLLFFISLRLQRKTRLTAALFVTSFCILLWRPAPPVLTIGNLHNQQIVINANHQAIKIQSTDSTNRPDKMVDRYLAYNGAKLEPSAFTSGNLKSGANFINSKNWLLVMTDPHQERQFRPYESAEILFLARKLQVEEVIIVTGRSAVMAQLMPSSEYIASDLKQTGVIPHEIKLDGFRGMAAMIFSKKNKD